ncbi:MAG TPA: carbamoyl-phosphate synthase (glutamine-hydrolyzing) large subunit [Candidatus Saccharimonadia bacterium]|nr:carbamoyl-phosphate synthase (glutamine-hydrolyzing) large subunit [Candidatus Saccharimonadia bacterium]
MKDLPQKILILGSGGLRIGQAGEFDYSGSQAIMAFKEEGIKTVLINPNIATVQTDGDMADTVYFQPLTPEVVERVIKKEQPDAIALSFGGQTALNLGLKLQKSGFLARHGVRVLGTPVSAIDTTEDREKFKRALEKISIKTARSRSVYSVAEAVAAAGEIGFPVMMRSGFSLGGLGSGRVASPAELMQKADEAFKATPQILIEEYLAGWKEIEYEVVRDAKGNTITVCNMENFDPMGVHTGESIVVAPSQTLTNNEYHGLREIAIKTITSLGIVGECNIQYALNPANGDYRVIEVNARLSRSSALASKATGYPLAFVAAKLMLGYALPELKNAVTGTTSAFFEPALDYLAVKMPRWDLTKLAGPDRTIGSEMKSVGEVMALGRSFPEALQKAVRMVNIGAQGLSDHPFEFPDPRTAMSRPTDHRLFAVYDFLKTTGDISTAHTETGIDPWFLGQMQHIAEVEARLRGTRLSEPLLRSAKQAGFSDRTIAGLTHHSEAGVRAQRTGLGIVPVIKQIDTLAGEFDATTNYLYVTYHGSTNDVEPLAKPKTDPSVIVLGSGPYCIGSSVEFDWCAVGLVRTLRQHGRHAIIINSNPETVSTDFNRSDRLYFEELTLERVQDIADFEAPAPLVVSVGGQTANNLAIPLANTGYELLGTPATAIDQAENRKRFSTLLNSLDIDQPAWQKVSTLERAKAFARKVGYPVLIRPSYVLSGGAMSVARDATELAGYLSRATKLSPDHPVVISRFIQGAKELEIDGVADHGTIVISAISEHIENAGVHSGDATVVLPPQRLYLETIRRAKKITTQIVEALGITGPFNLQFIAKGNELKVIEANIRASRSFPFVSKVTGHNFITIATEVLLNAHKPAEYETLELDYVGVKSPLFSYNRLKGADPVAGVEMASTGEVAAIGGNLLEAFYASWLATDQPVSGHNLYISVPDEQKAKILEPAAGLAAAGWNIFATIGTHVFLKEHGISSQPLYKIHEKTEPAVETAINTRQLSLMINVPSGTGDDADARHIRRLAVDHHIPLVTNAEIAVILLRCLGELKPTDLPVTSWQEYTSPTNPNRGRTDHHDQARLSHHRQPGTKRAGKPAGRSR